MEGASPETERDVQIDRAVANADGRITVVVRLEDRSDRAIAATEADDQIGSMRSHASDTQTAFERFADGNPHVEIERRFWITNALLVTVDTDRVPIERLGMVDRVTAVHENFEMEALDGATTTAPGAPSVTTDGPTAPTMTDGSTTSSTVDVTYGLEKIRAPETWETFGSRGAGVKVAVLDTGIDADHADLALAENGWAEFDRYGKQVNSTPYDSGYHGTHVSGTVAGGNASGTWIGVAPDVELYHGKVLDDGGTYAQVIAGMEWAVENDVDVISMSLGGPNRAEEYLEPVRNAEQAGTIVVSSSGNDGAGTSSSPADVHEVFSIGATGSDDTVADFSSGETVYKHEWDNPPGAWPQEYTVPDVAAPGVSVFSAYPNDQWTKLSGTSMAAPHVSGSIALLLSNTDATLSPAEIRTLFEDTAVDIGEADHRQGAGRIDVYEAVLAQSRNTIDPTFTPATANVSEPTTITVDVDHPVEAYHWKFEDGTTRTTTAPEVEHAFPEPGPRAVNVTIDDGSEPVTVSTTVDVVDTVAPSVALDAPDVPIVGANTTFNASASSDNHEIERYEWQFGDGTAVNTTEPIVTHAFEEAGEYTLNLTVVDPSGNTNATATTLTARHPPAVSVDAPADGTATADANVTIEYTLENTDIEGAAALEYRIEAANADEPVVDWTGGPFEATAQPASFAVHTGDLADGNYTVSLRLLDGDGSRLPYDAATDVVDVTVKTTPPALELGIDTGAYPAIGPHNPVTVNVTTTDHRHESTTIAITNGTNEVATWDRSAETGDGEVTSIDWNGTDDAGVPVASGEYTITATATDDLGNENTTSAVVAVDTDAPTVDVTSIDGATASDGVVYVNDTSGLDIAIDVRDSGPIADSIEAVSIVLESNVTTYRISPSVERINGTDYGWTATVEAGAFPDPGDYRVRASVTDSARNANETIAAEPVEYDRTAPQLSTVVTGFNETASEATVAIRSDEPLDGTPELTVTGPDGNETPFDGPTALENSTTRWTGTFPVNESGAYELATTGTDRAANQGSETTETMIRPTSTENRTVTIHNDRTGTFVTLNTTADVSDSIVTLSETGTPPAQLAADSIGVDFLTTVLADELDRSLSEATIGIPVEQARLPDTVAADDDAVTLQWYNETGDRWEQRPLTVREFDAADGDPVDGEYWVATVDGFSTYGVTVTDDRPPELVGAAPADGETLAHDTETATVKLEYADELSAIDVSSIELSIDGRRVTADERTQITSTATVHEGLPVEPGASYAIALDIADEAGNERRLETQFEVAADGGDDGSGGGGGGGGGFSLPERSAPVDLVPTAVIAVDPHPATVGEEIVISGAESTDEVSDINSYEWSIAGERFAGETVTTSFDEPGHYDVELTVTNDRRRSDTASATIVVEESPSAASPTPDEKGVDERSASDDESVDGGNGAFPVPGFEMPVTLVVFLAVALLFARRQH